MVIDDRLHPEPCIEKMSRTARIRHTMSNESFNIQTTPNIGISIRSSYGSELPPREGAKQILDRAQAASEAQLDSLFLGDHHATRTPYYQNIPMMGRLLASWSGPEAGVLLLLPLWSPVLAAELIATLATLTSSRFVMQCGIGYGAKQFAAMGADHLGRGERFTRALDLIPTLWSGESVSDSLWKVDRAVISPLPPEPIDIWIGATAPVALRRVAKTGHVWLADPGLAADALVKKRDRYYAECEVEGRSPNPRMALRRDVHIAESTRACEALRAQLSKEGYRGIDPDALIIATVDEACDRFSALAELGFTDIITRHLHPDQNEAVASIHRLGEVRERLKASQ